MRGCSEISRVALRIAELFLPEKIILYAKKINIYKNDIKNFSLCVIMHSDDNLLTERDIYLKVESDIPFDILVYTPKQWQNLIADKHTFACSTIQKGTVLYEKK